MRDISSQGTKEVLEQAFPDIQLTPTSNVSHCPVLREELELGDSKYYDMHPTNQNHTFRRYSLVMISALNSLLLHYGHCYRTVPLGDGKKYALQLLELRCASSFLFNNTVYGGDSDSIYLYCYRKH